MTEPYLGGLRITGVRWSGKTTIAVRFSSSYGNAYQYQLYAGRRMIGCTSITSERVISGTLTPSDSPQHLTVLAVEPTRANTDYGSRLPMRPYNVVRIGFTTSGWTDAEKIEVSSGAGAGDAVDASNVIATRLFDTNRRYTVDTPPLAETGQWNFEVAGRDGTEPNGNRGTALALSANVVVYPPDVTLNANGSRFSVSIDSQVATVTYGLGV